MLRLLSLARLERLIRDQAPEADQAPLLDLINEIREAHDLGLLPPDWEDINKRFNYRGMDSKGSWYAYTDHPLQNSTGYQRLQGEMMFIRGPASHRWSEMLRERPNHDNS